MTSQWKAAANRRNALKSTGPKSASGRAVVRRNALRHGLAAEAVVFDEDDAEEFRLMAEEHRAAFRPRNDVELQLAASFSIAAWIGQQCAIVESRMTNQYMRQKPVDVERALKERVIGLGERLFFDPGNLWRHYPDPLAGKDPEFEHRQVPGDTDLPPQIVLELESTDLGCAWLLDQWKELKNLTRPGHAWRACDKFKLVRLLGKEPLDSLPDIIDRAIARLERLAREHRKRSKAEAAERNRRLAFDPRKEACRVRRYADAAFRRMSRACNDFIELRESAIDELNGAAGLQFANSPGEPNAEPAPASRSDLIGQRSAPAVEPIEQCAAALWGDDAKCDGGRRWVEAGAHEGDRLANEAGCDGLRPLLETMAACPRATGDIGPIGDPACFPAEMMVDCPGAPLDGGGLAAAETANIIAGLPIGESDSLMGWQSWNPTSDLSLPRFPFDGLGSFIQAWMVLLCLLWAAIGGQTEAPRRGVVDPGEMRIERAALGERVDRRSKCEACHPSEPRPAQIKPMAICARRRGGGGHETLIAGGGYAEKSRSRSAEIDGWVAKRLRRTKPWQSVPVARAPPMA